MRLPTFIWVMQTIHSTSRSWMSPHCYCQQEAGLQVCELRDGSCTWRLQSATNWLDYVTWGSQFKIWIPLWPASCCRNSTVRLLVAIKSQFPKRKSFAVLTYDKNLFLLQRGTSLVCLWPFKKFTICQAKQITPIPETNCLECNEKHHTLLHFKDMSVNMATNSEMAEVLIEDPRFCSLSVILNLKHWSDLKAANKLDLEKNKTLGFVVYTQQLFESLYPWAFRRSSVSRNRPPACSWRIPT